jgi:TPR repeat protein
MRKLIVIAIVLYLPCCAVDLQPVIDVVNRISKGERPQEGFGLEKSHPETAPEWLEIQRKRVRSLEGTADFAEAAFSLGSQLILGTFSPPDYDEAFQWFHQAAEAGHMEGESAVAAFYSGSYESHWSGQINFSKAAYWLRRLAKRGDTLAAKQVALLEQAGLVKKKDEL